LFNATQFRLSYKTPALRSFVVAHGGAYVNIDTICQNGMNSTKIVTAGQAAISNK
jgi:hypothetical protein